jgi:hypothetical protein
MCHKNSFTFCGQAKKKGETSWYFDSDKKSFEGGYSLRQTKNFLRSLENNQKCNKAKKKCSSKSNRKLLQQTVWTCERIIDDVVS